MNKLRVILFFSLTGIVLQGSAQYTLTSLYTGWFLHAKDTNTAQDRFVVDFTSDQWLEVPEGIKFQAYSRGFAFQRMFDMPFGRNFGVAFGFGITSNHYYHNGTFARLNDTNNRAYDTLMPLPAGTNYKINKLALNYIDGSFEFRIRSSGKNPFKFYPGFKIGYMFNGHSKFVDDVHKYKLFRISGMKDLRYGPYLRVGIRNITLYGMYSLTPFYKNERGQEIQNFSVGISLLFL